MIDDLKAMAIFAEVIKKGSFRQAAKSLSLSPSVISYHVSQLEEKLGAALIYRSTRKLSLSYEGEVFYQQVLKMLTAADQGINMLLENQLHPQGKVTLSLPTALSRSSINDKLADFAKQYPEVKLSIDFSDDKKDLFTDNIDLIIRASSLQDSDLKAKKIGMLKRVLVCSKDFYQQFPEPKSCHDISHWPWIKLTSLSNQRTFNYLGEQQKITLNTQINVNSVEAIYHYCRRGVGLAILEQSQVKQELQRGELQHVLPKWQVEPLPLYALWAKNIPQNSNVKRLVAYLQ